MAESYRNVADCDLIDECNLLEAKLQILLDEKRRKPRAGFRREKAVHLRQETFIRATIDRMWSEIDRRCLSPIDSDRQRSTTTDGRAQDDASSSSAERSVVPVASSSRRTLPSGKGLTTMRRIRLARYEIKKCIWKRKKSRPRAKVSDRLWVFLFFIAFSSSLHRLSLERLFRSVFNLFCHLFFFINFLQEKANCPNVTSPENKEERFEKSIQCFPVDWKLGKNTKLPVDEWYHWGWRHE